MIARIIHFAELKRNKLSTRLCWRMSGMWMYEQAIKKVASLIVVTLGALYLMSSAANAVVDYSDNKSATKIKQQQSEIAELKKIVAACLGDSKIGGTILIGDEWFFCGLTSIGKFK